MRFFIFFFIPVLNFTCQNNLTLTQQKLFYIGLKPSCKEYQRDILCNFSKKCDTKFKDQVNKEGCIKCVQNNIENPENCLTYKNFIEPLQKEVDALYNLCLSSSLRSADECKAIVNRCSTFHTNSGRLGCVRCMMNLNPSKCLSYACTQFYNNKDKFKLCLDCALKDNSNIYHCYTYAPSCSFLSCPKKKNACYKCVYKNPKNPEDCIDVFKKYESECELLDKEDEDLCLKCITKKPKNAKLCLDCSKQFHNKKDKKRCIECVKNNDNSNECLNYIK